LSFAKVPFARTQIKTLLFKKIQGIRGSFRKELKKIKKTLKSGCGEEDVHKPSLWYFDLLQHAFNLTKD